MAAGCALIGNLAGCGARGFIDEEQLIDNEVVAAGGGSGGSSSLGGSGDGGGGRNSVGGSTSGGGSGGSAGGQSSTQPYHFETSMLQRCEPGFVWSPADSRACVFRFDNRCYDDEDSVCACACPRNRNSVCVLSGFLSDPNNPLMVSCTAK